MWKKTFIRLSFIGLVVLATLVVFASSNRPIVRDTDTDTEECTSSSAQKQDCNKKAQSDFILWESLSKTIMSSVSY